MSRDLGMLKVLAGLIAGVASSVPTVSAFGHMVTRQQDVYTQCLSGFQGLDAACGNAAPGSVVPSSCASGYCQQAVTSWWPNCKQQQTYAYIDLVHNHSLTHFYETCKTASKPTCGACSGHASAKDTLPESPLVLVKGSAMRTRFTSQFTGEVADLLCVPSGQVSITEIKRAQAPAAAVWTKQSLKHCSGSTVGSAYSSLSAAEAACSTNSKCSGVYASSCASSGSFYQCDSNSLQTSSFSCVYTKPLVRSGLKAYQGYMSYRPPGCYYGQGAEYSFLGLNTNLKQIAECNRIDNHVQYECICRITGVVWQKREATTCATMSDGKTIPGVIGTAGANIGKVLFSTFDEAKTACLEVAGCHGVFDNHCDGQNAYSLCGVQAAQLATSLDVPKSCVYTLERTTAPTGAPTALSTHGPKQLASHPAKVDECTSSENDCDKALAECIHGGAKHECVCHAGYETYDGGKTCKPIAECASSPCMNSGTCTEGTCSSAACMVQYSCTCPSGWTGAHCEVRNGGSRRQV